ncbi:MAG TPA: Gfo/Idh/MocA family oxidoreductase, partial [Limnochordia bacterium]
MPDFRVAIIGCGGRGKAHAKGYALCPATEIVACADPVEENAAALRQDFGVPRSYTDYREMLAKERVDIVSVCTWPHLHREMVLAAAAAGAKAIHCEKPIAPTWGAAREIVSTCQEAGVVLTFCHQRRFAAPFIAARNLVRSGSIGELWRLEGYCSNLFDWGTHWFDMFFFYNDETPADWVMGQIDASEPRPVFGVPVETRGMSYIHFTNDVWGLMLTGRGMGGHCENRLLGSDGIIEVRNEVPRVRVRKHGSDGWEAVPLEGLAPHP